MKLDKYLKVILTIIALCLIWLIVKDVVIGSNVLYGNIQKQKVQPIRKPTAQEKEMIEISNRWTVIGGGVRYLEEKGELDDLTTMFVEAIQAGYVPRFSVGATDILFMEKLK